MADLETADLSAALAEHAVGFSAERLDDVTLDHLRANLLDVVGVSLGGVHAEGLEAVRAFLASTSAVGPSVVWGTSELLAVPGAALANATAGHALEFDDAFDEGGGMHAGPPVHAAALAVADGLGGVSGRDYLAAVAVGLDVAVRLALAPKHDIGWHRASVYAVFGATAAAGRLLGLDVGRLRNALGLSLSQASGTRQSIHEARRRDKRADIRAIRCLRRPAWPSCGPATRRPGSRSIRWLSKRWSSWSTGSMRSPRPPSSPRCWPLLDHLTI